MPRDGTMEAMVYTGLGGACVLLALSSRSSVGAHDCLTRRHGRQEHIPPINGTHEHLRHNQDACEHYLQTYGLLECLLHSLDAYQYLMHGPDRREHLLQGHN